MKAADGGVSLKVSVDYSARTVLPTPFGVTRGPTDVEGRTMPEVVVAGQFIGPVLGPSCKHGKGSLAVTSDGVAWTLKKTFKNLSGLVPWNVITSWEAGLSEMAPNARAYVVYVMYANDPTGCLQLALPVRPGARALVEGLTEAAAAYLPAEAIDAQFA